MTRVLDRYAFDLSDIRRAERLFGEELPDLLGPIRQADADVDVLMAQIDEYKMLAASIGELHADLTTARGIAAWEGEAAASADGFWEGVLTVLKWIVAIILYVVAALLMLVSLLLFVIAKLCELVGIVLSWVTAAVAVIVALVALVLTRGKAKASWEILKQAMSGQRLQIMGIVQNLGQMLALIFETAAKGVMWLALLLVEVGADLTGQPSDQVKEERDKLFA